MTNVRTQPVRILLATVFLMAASDLWAQPRIEALHGNGFRASITRAAAQPTMLVQSRLHRPRTGTCRRKVLRGLAIGAGVGLGYGLIIAPRVEEPVEIVTATTAMSGLIGLVIGLNACR